MFFGARHSLSPLHFAIAGKRGRKQRLHNGLKWWSLNYYGRGCCYFNKYFISSAWWIPNWSLTVIVPGRFSSAANCCFKAIGNQEDNGSGWGRLVQHPNTLNKIFLTAFCWKGRPEVHSRCWNGFPTVPWSYPNKQLLIIYSQFNLIYRKIRFFLYSWIPLY